MIFAIINAHVTKLTNTITNRMKKLINAYFTGKTGTSGLHSSVYPTL